MAVTYTSAQTFARFDLLELQVRTMLREAVEIDSDTLERVSRGLRDPHYIEVVIVRGLFRHGTVGAELKLSINWRQHRLELKSAGPRLAAPTSWAGGVAPSVAEGVRTFLIACSNAGLQREWVVTYGSQFDEGFVNRLLGFERAPYRSWERRPDSTGDLGLGALAEGSLVVSLAI